MVKADLARAVYEAHGGLSYHEAKQVVENIIRSVRDSLVRGENVKLSGFGSFQLVTRKERMGRNPQTGQHIRLGPSKYVTFRHSRTVQY